ncbi:MAG: ribonuclease E activity regulator RraA [Gammaproteobacteria bacterium]|nr:ribonuclease E activity regulator RraA [Gammaproteobacteria bacterium]
MTFKTADLYDLYADDLSIVTPGFLSFGAHQTFHGAIATVKVHEDNVLVKQQLSEPGDKRVLVVDGGGSMRCALMGDMLAQLAITNDWAGVIIYGCIRDSADIEQMPIGVKALGTHPAKSVKRGAGICDQPVTFCGVCFRPGDHVYCDADGIVVAPTKLQA